MRGAEMPMHNRKSQNETPKQASLARVGIKHMGLRYLIVGLGVSGLWSARLLVGHGADVTVSEIRPQNELDPAVLAEVLNLGARLETGGHKRDTFLNTDMIIVSPGVPLGMEPLQGALKKGIPVIGELEFASRLIETPLIAVTGTNGKSTVTALLGQIIENAGFRVFVGGNIGTPLAAFAAKGGKGDYGVVEISSFQLDSIQTFSPLISLILNISPDHLDHYPSYESYVNSKLRIFENQRAGTHLIINDDDPRLALVSPPSGVSLLRYGVRKKGNRHAFVKGNGIRVTLDGIRHDDFSCESLKLPGPHNRENLMAAILCGRALGIDPLVIQKSADQFGGLPNRLEKVAEVDNVVFYNDSKATNVDAAVKAVLSFDRPLIIIAGGRHKGADYGTLVDAAKGRVRGAVFLGEAKELLAKSFEGLLPFSFAEDMEEAVLKAFSWAKSGDAVLLAPACSSFDMFSDYADRGNAFRSYVLRLSHGSQAIG
jgi:UDP-N-acetylmuramoylalanine--D-glutamate ligase